MPSPTLNKPTLIFRIISKISSFIHSDLALSSAMDRRQSFFYCIFMETNCSNPIRGRHGSLDWFSTKQRLELIKDLMFKGVFL